MLVDREEYEEAQEALTKAAALDPTNADIRMTLSNALRLQGRYEEAGAACNAALDCAPTAYSLGWAGYLPQRGWRVWKGMRRTGPGNDHLYGRELVVGCIWVGPSVSRSGLGAAIARML